MAWSIFSQGGGNGAAVTWAQDLEKQLKVPQSPANTKFIYDWEVSEGGGGKYNPLNQGPVPGSPQLTSTGQQYGGGAADFTSWQAGITGAADYIEMPAYAAILKAMSESDESSAVSALVNSSWASSHYNNGASFSNAAPPGATALGSGGGTVTGNGSTAASGTSNSILGSVEGAAVTGALSAFGITPSNIEDLLERAGLMIIGVIAIFQGIKILTEGKSGGSSSNSSKRGAEAGVGEDAAKVAEVAPEAAVAA